ncbi:tetratricopeptide repeat protein [Saccharothrix sp. NRRL B-16348]|uniref:tetratricopeptide repeat protein n=1 Tax=Saccharothrix sp. NRRL B-16348 TaxID=1415542 RepID=UPI0006AEE4AC|nr:tetratricopeptide repeat protein [Saccharothrix sp. NRRL B-16348]
MADHDVSAADVVNNDISGTVTAGTVVQAGHVAHLHVRPDPPLALAGLPPTEAAFTGRAQDLAKLAEALTSPRPVLVTAVAGLAGVGKTTLAVRAASRFAGGVLFIDLRGYSDSPVQPAEALSVFLHALGVPGEHVPADPAARANLYRSVLADRAEPVLVVADNASSADQVRPLLPGGGKHRVLVTSREVLGELSAHQVRVDVLPPAEAEELIRAAVRTRDPERVLDGPVAELAALCGHLPLALGIAAALLAEDVDLSVRDLVDLVANATNRLDELEYAGNYAVRAAFELSYQRLREPERRAFRLLSLNPGAQTSAEAAAALVGEPVDKAKRLLAGLKRAHMVEPAGPGRVRFHDLLRIFAEECCARDEPDRRSPFERLLDHYVSAARAASPSWIGVERTNLVAVVELADDDRAVDLAVAIGDSSAPTTRWDDWESTYRHALVAAERRNRWRDERVLLNRLAMLVLEQRRFDEARELCERALARHRGFRDKHGEAIALNTLGDLALDLRDFDLAGRLYVSAAHMFIELGDRRWQAIVYNHLGTLRCWQREFGMAQVHFMAARQMYRRVGDVHGEARVLANLGNLALQTGDLAGARALSLQGLEIFRAVGDRLGTAKVLVNLGIAHERVRLVEKAREYWGEARDVFRGFGDSESASHVERWLAELGGHG